MKKIIIGVLAIIVVVFSVGLMTSKDVTITTSMHKNEDGTYTQWKYVDGELDSVNYLTAEEWIEVINK